MGVITEYCGHRYVTRVDGGKYWCHVCQGERQSRIRKHPPARPHLVNGYWLSDSDYEIVMGYRRERDRAIAAAKNGYQAKLTALLDLVKGDRSTSSPEVPGGE